MSFKFLTIILLSIHSSFLVVGQNAKPKDSLTVKIMINKIVKSNKDLQAKIVVKNISTASVSVYKVLQYGDFIGSQLGFDRTNFVLILEEKKGNKFIENTSRSRIDFVPPGEDTLDDREKIILVPNDSIIYSFHVDGISGFKVGSHRLRCYYTNHFQAAKGIQSKWFYFQVLHEIFAKHDYETY
jgi:hypothetical protein